MLFVWKTGDGFSFLEKNELLAIRFDHARKFDRLRNSVNCNVLWQKVVTENFYNYKHKLICYWPLSSHFDEYMAMEQRSTDNLKKINENTFLRDVRYL